MTQLKEYVFINILDYAPDFWLMARNRIGSWQRYGSILQRGQMSARRRSVKKTSIMLDDNENTFLRANKGNSRCGAIATYRNLIP
jgi:hypothetical protein